MSIKLFILCRKSSFTHKNHKRSLMACKLTSFTYIELSSLFMRYKHAIVRKSTQRSHSYTIIFFDTVRVAYCEPPWDQKSCSLYRDFILSELYLIQMHENIYIGTFGLVHNKQMFIISGFIISDPDCILDFLQFCKLDIIKL